MSLKLPPELRKKLKENWKYIGGKERTFLNPFDPARTERFTLKSEQEFLELCVRCVLNMDKRGWWIFTQYCSPTLDFN